MIPPAGLELISVRADGVLIEIQPFEITYNKKQNAGTTFSIMYPNPDSLSRGIFQEFKTIIQVFDQGALVLEGVVIRIMGKGIVTITCADPIYQTSKEQITPEEVNELATLDCGRAIAEIVKSTNGAGTIVEQIIGTNPIIQLPRDFITAATSKSAVIKKIFQFIEEQTSLNNPTPTRYFYGFDNGILRFEPLPSVEDAFPSLILRKEDESLFEEPPQYHFDRVINIARAYGKDESGAVITGEIFRDEQSISIHGEKWPREPIELDTDNLFTLQQAATKRVLNSKDLFVSRKLEIPGAHHLLPGIHIIRTFGSVYGIDGDARVVQVQGGFGKGKTVKAVLDTVPVDEIEVILTIVNEEARA